MMSAYHYAINNLGLSGVAVFVGPNSVPPDNEMFEPLYAACEKNGTPIWLHPNRPQFMSDYRANNEGNVGSKYAIWNSLGWVYDTR